MLLPNAWFLLASLGSAAVVQSINKTAIRQTCDAIEAQCSDASKVMTFRGIGYFEAIEHWIKSSEQEPVCVVQPASAEDLSVAIRLIGQNRVPFAVQSGGHTSNPGFSSTKGVHISLSKLNEVTLSSDGTTARVGAGNRWSNVYKKLEGSGRNVVGGRVPGPGVGGFTTGGGYSWKTNMYGLTVDTIKSYTLVLPNGTITTVDDSTPDLFFALRGGLNRFGVVAHVDLFTHAQVPMIYGGTRIYAGDEVDKIINATAGFAATNRDPKATVITSVLGKTATTQFFYDGPSKPASFAVFDGIDTLLVDTVKTQKFSEFVSSIPSSLRDVTNVRGTWETFSTTGASLTFMQALQKEGKVLLDLAWAFSKDDQYWHTQLRQSRDTLIEVARSEGLLHPIAYSNYAAADTSAEKLYGSAGAARLASIRNAVDPHRVMDLTGGYQV